MDSMENLRRHLLNLLDMEGAHVDFDSALERFPANLRDAKPEGAPYTPWQLLEHLRIAQWDILEFSRDPKHVSPKWPDGYWPDSDAPPNARAWEQSVEQFRRDLAAMKDLVSDPQSDLFANIPHGDGQTLLREALLVADHNSYHVGQLVLLRKILGTWKE